MVATPSIGIGNLYPMDKLVKYAENPLYFHVGCIYKLSF